MSKLSKPIRDFAARFFPAGYGWRAGGDYRPGKAWKRLLPAPVQAHLACTGVVASGLWRGASAGRTALQLGSDWRDLFGQLLRGTWTVAAPRSQCSVADSLALRSASSSMAGVQNAIYRLSRVTPAWTHLSHPALTLTRISMRAHRHYQIRPSILPTVALWIHVSMSCLPRRSSVESAAGASVPPDAQLPPTGPPPVCKHRGYTRSAAGCRRI